MVMVKDAVKQSELTESSVGKDFFAKWTVKKLLTLVNDLEGFDSKNRQVGQLSVVTELAVEKILSRVCSKKSSWLEAVAFWGSSQVACQQAALSIKSKLQGSTELSCLEVSERLFFGYKYYSVVPVILGHLGISTEELLTYLDHESELIRFSALVVLFRRGVSSKTNLSILSAYLRVEQKVANKIMGFLILFKQLPFCSNTSRYFQEVLSDRKEPVKSRRAVLSLSLFARFQDQKSMTTNYLSVVNNLLALPAKYHQLADYSWSVDEVKQIISSFDLPKVSCLFNSSGPVLSLPFRTYLQDSLKTVIKQSLKSESGLKLTQLGTAKGYPKKLRASLPFLLNLNKGSLKTITKHLDPKNKWMRFCYLLVLFQRKSRLSPVDLRLITKQARLETDLVNNRLYLTLLYPHLGDDEGIQHYFESILSDLQQPQELRGLAIYLAVLGSCSPFYVNRRRMSNVYLETLNNLIDYRSQFEQLQQVFVFDQREVIELTAVSNLKLDLDQLPDAQRLLDQVIGEFSQKIQAEHQDLKFASLGEVLALNQDCRALIPKVLASLGADFQFLVGYLKRKKELVRFATLLEIFKLKPTLTDENLIKLALAFKKEKAVANQLVYLNLFADQADLPGEVLTLLDRLVWVDNSAYSVKQLAFSILSSQVGAENLLLDLWAKKDLFLGDVSQMDPHFYWAFKQSLAALVSQPGQLSEQSLSFLEEALLESKNFAVQMFVSCLSASVSCLAVWELLNQSFLAGRYELANFMKLISYWPDRNQILLDFALDQTLSLSQRELALDLMSTDNLSLAQEEALLGLVKNDLDLRDMAIEKLPVYGKSQLGKRYLAVLWGLVNKNKLDDDCQDSLFLLGQSGDPVTLKKLAKFGQDSSDDISELITDYLESPDRQWFVTAEMKEDLVVELFSSPNWSRKKFCLLKLLDRTVYSTETEKLRFLCQVLVNFGLEDREFLVRGNV